MRGALFCLDVSPYVARSKKDGYAMTRNAFRGTFLAATLALMAPAVLTAPEALAAFSPAEDSRLAQARRPSPAPTLRPVPTPLPPAQEPIRRGTEPVQVTAVTAPEDKTPMDLTIGLEYEFGSATSGGFAANAQSVPTAITNATSALNAWSGLAEIGLGAFDLGAKYTNYMGVLPLTVGNPAGGFLPFYWPQETWSAYGRMGALRLGYLNEFFGRGIGSDGAIGSVILGLDGGFPLVVDMLDMDYSLTGGWGVIGQGPGHIPAEAKVSLSVVLGPVNLSGGYVGRASFTGEPGTFLTALTNPAQLSTGDAATVNQTRLGTYQGPFVGVSMGF